MKLRRKAYFIEFAVLLLQRTMEEGHPDLVLKWGQSIFEFLSRCAFTMYLFDDYKKSFNFIIIVSFHAQISNVIVKTSNNALLSTYLRIIPHFTIDSSCRLDSMWMVLSLSGVTSWWDCPQNVWKETVRVKEEVVVVFRLQKEMNHPRWKYKYTHKYPTHTCRYTRTQHILNICAILNIGEVRWHFSCLQMMHLWYCWTLPSLMSCGFSWMHIIYGCICVCAYIKLF